MKTTPILALVACGLFAAGFLPTMRVAAQAARPAAQSNAALTGNAAKGKQSYTKQTCNTCHGNDAQGIAENGPRIGPPSRNFSDFLAFVRNPMGDGSMPPVSRQRVPDSEVADIYAYLSSLGSAPRTSSSPPAVFSAASGNVEHGKRIYTSYGCYECHGLQGQGSSATAGPRIGPPALSLPAFAAYVRQPTGAMPPYTNIVVSDQDMADIFAFAVNTHASTGEEHPAFEPVGENANAAVVEPGWGSLTKCVERFRRYRASAM